MPTSTSTSVHTHSYAKIPVTIKPKTTSNLPFNRHPIFKSKTCYLFTTLTSPITFTGNHRRLRGSTIRAAADTGKKDYYSSLNVSRSATLQEIKSSYRKLARQYHPDMNKTPGAEDKFKEISVAYEVLSDDEKRSLYDRFGHPGLQEQYDGFDLRSQGVDPFDVFDAYFRDSNSFFGGNNRTASLDIRYDLSLDLKESIFGGQRDIEVLSFDTCDKCDGSGAKSSSCIKGCSDCGGRGGVMKSQRTPFGMMSQVSTCLKCGGGGKIITDYCPKCNGDGKVQLKRSIKVVIPPGVNDGATMKVQGEGSFDKRRGRGGDLYLFIHIKGKDGIWRDGLNLYSKITIDYTEAILGTVVKVETVEGLRDLHISPGIQPGDTIKLPSMGVPKLNKPSIRGDHLFIVHVMIPKDISDAERRLVEKLVSVKASTRVNSGHDNGAHETNHGKEKIKHPQYSSSGEAVNDSSLWSSIRRFLGGKPSSTRFASINMEILKPARIYCKSEVLVGVPILLILLSTCIDSVAGRIGSCRVLKPQRNTQPNSKRNDS